MTVAHCFYAVRTTMRCILSNVTVVEETRSHTIVCMDECQQWLIHTGAFVSFTHSRCVSPTVISDTHPPIPYREFIAVMDASRGPNADTYTYTGPTAWYRLTSPKRRRHYIIACTLRMRPRMRRRYAPACMGVIVWMSHASSCYEVIAVDYTGVIPRGARVLTCGNMQRALGCLLTRNRNRSDSEARRYAARLLVLAPARTRRRICVVTVFYPGHNPFRLRVSTKSRIVATASSRVFVAGGPYDNEYELKPPQLCMYGYQLYDTGHERAQTRKKYSSRPC